MHEYHAVKELLDQVIVKAKANGAARISKIKIVVGKLLGFEESSLRLYFETISEETIAAGSLLEIRYVDSNSQNKSGGREFYIDNIEIEKAAE
jgi:hydrogenase nickel incorporation protein HypA/HybF